MSANPLEEILELAAKRKPVAKLQETDAQVIPASETHAEADHGEWKDNEDMHSQGLTMGPAGCVNYGAMKLGHVVAIPGRKAQYIGVHHPSGAMTEAHPNRARAALGLMAYHHFLPHANEDSAHPGMKLSNEDISTVLELAQKNKSAAAPKPYGASVEYGDPKNGKFPLDKERIHAALGYIDHEDVKAKYPLNGVTWESVKARVVAAAKKQGIKVSS